MSRAEVYRVTMCGGCPFVAPNDGHASYCMADSEERAIDELGDVPSWCPLRTRSIRVELLQAKPRRAPR